MKHEFVAEKSYARLSELVSEQIAFLPLSVIKNQIRVGEVRKNGKKVLRDEPLSEGDDVRIFLPAALQPQEKPLETVYADDHVVIVAKPILCETETHLTKLVGKEYGNVVPVHRLDRNTIGLVIFARSKAVEDELVRLTKLKKITKTYRALVCGHLKPQARNVTVYLHKNAAASFVRISDTPKEGYLAASLSYQVVQQIGDDSEVEVTLTSGRTHQIRATLSHLGHPVVGDGKYGTEVQNRARRQRYQQLCAYRIDFSFQKTESKLLQGLSGKEIIWNNYEFSTNI